MSAEKMQYCWDIMHCDEKTPCPVRENKLDRCWEWMKKHNQFQSQYDLCDECIVYLYHSRSSVLSNTEMEQAMMRRGLYEKEVYTFDLRDLR